VNGYEININKNVIDEAMIQNVIKYEYHNPLGKYPVKKTLYLMNSD